MSAGVSSVIGVTFPSANQQTVRSCPTCNRIVVGMAKDKVSAKIDQAVLQAADVDAKDAGPNRSEMIEQALRNEHLRLSLKNYTSHTVPTLDIDTYAQTVYRANRASGHGYTPTQAVQLAEAAAKLSGGHIPAWVRDINIKVAHGELTGDEAVQQIKARITQGSER